jgi:hypothetical protein
VFALITSGPIVLAVTAGIPVVLGLLAALGARGRKG